MKRSTLGFMLAAAFHFAVAPNHAAWAHDEPPEPVMTVTVLGSGTPIPSATQFGSAILVQAGENSLMFDCGRGCSTRLAQLDTALIPKVDRLFLTHLHSDHTTGVDDLWLNGWVLGRRTPLAVWGPEGTTQMMAHLRQAYTKDIEYRTADGLPPNEDGIAPHFTDLAGDGGVLLDLDGLKVTALSVVR